jgi:hypothetical protein
MNEEHKFGILENRVMRIIDPQGMKIAGGHRILSNEKQHNLQAYSSPNITRKIKSYGHYLGICTGDRECT